MKIDANGTEIRVMGDVVNEDAYISLTDIAKYKNPDNTFIVVANWMRNHSTISFLGLWEQIHNPNFKPIEFDRFKAESGDNAFTLTPQQWIKSTDAIGIISKSGRYGGTYAHSDIAFEFASWVSAEFKLYIIKDYKRLNYGRTDFAEWTDCSSDRKFILQIPEARGCKLWISKDGKVLQMYGDAILQK